MPTDKPPRLNLTFNEDDIKQLNEIREKFTQLNKTKTYSYIDVIRILMKYGANYTYAVLRD